MLLGAGALCVPRGSAAGWTPVSELVRPYARENYNGHGMITPADVHRWLDGEHSEMEWQARERVLIDQQRDARDAARRGRTLAGVGFWMAIYGAVASVLAFALISHRDPIMPAGPLWAIIMGIVTAVVALAGFVATWMGLADWHELLTCERVADRALREHHIGYADRA